MKTQLIILGLLKKEGEMHGYRLTQEAKEQISDFADIKFPRLYYHLNKLEERGLISSRQEQEGNRPERTVFKLTELGEGAFTDMLAKSMDFQYKVEFDMDAALFFSGNKEIKPLLGKLEQYREKIKEKLDQKKFRMSVAKRKKDHDGQGLTEMVYRHQIQHLEAEHSWLGRLLEKIKKTEQ